MLSTEVFDSPCKHPNGLQWTKDGLYVMDQELDDVYILEESGKISKNYKLLQKMVQV